MKYKVANVSIKSIGWGQRLFDCLGVG